MPVRSLNSSVFKWPDAATVVAAARRWAAAQAQDNPKILAIGFIGSYARGDWGVGSDLDLLMIVAETEEPFWQRPAAYDRSTLPVPADLLVYTKAEWETMARQQTRFYRTAAEEGVWVYQRDPQA